MRRSIKHAILILDLEMVILTILALCVVVIMSGCSGITCRPATNLATVQDRINGGDADYVAFKCKGDL